MVFILSLISFHSVLMNKQISRIRVLIVLRFIELCFCRGTSLKQNRHDVMETSPNCIVSIPITFPCPCVFITWNWNWRSSKSFPPIHCNNAITDFSLLARLKLVEKRALKLLVLASHTHSAQIFVRWRGGQAWIFSLGEKHQVIFQKCPKHCKNCECCPGHSLIVSH